jgi:hypothetical protein
MSLRFEVIAKLRWVIVIKKNQKDQTWRWQIVRESINMGV